MAAIRIIFLTTWLLLIISHSIQALGARGRMEKDILDKLFSQNQYDKRIRPSSANGVNGTDGPTIVKVNMYLRSIESLDDLKMEYKVQVTLRQRWTDDRLVYDDLGGKVRYLTLSDTEILWMPDLFVKNEREGNFHDMVRPNMYIRVSPDGGILYSTRLSLTLSCPMDLKLYPMDRQDCQLLLASYSHTTENIILLWEEYNPVQITKSVHLPRFTLMKFTADYCNSKTNTGEYACLRLDLRFWREFSHYLQYIYVLCSMLVIVSYLSFYLDRKAITARITMATISLALLSLGCASLNREMPPVSYTKAIDVWTGMCVTFVFSALCECVLVNFLNPPSPDETSKFQGFGRLVDLVSRIAYPAAFLLFNMIYWTTYLNADTGDEECNGLNCHRVG